MLRWSKVFFHNLSRYDAHLFINNLGSVDGKIDCIPKNEENYISFSKEIVIGKYIDEKGKEKESKRETRFLDSLRFMQYPLAKLASYLTRDSFNNLSKSYHGEELDLLVRKGVFPYDWFDCFDKLNVTELPPKEAFYSKITDEHISLLISEDIADVIPLFSV